MSHELIVIGGGAAGMLAAITAAQAGVSVCLIERNPKLGRKLYITGKGRCNLTNHCTPQEVLAAVPCNARFLHSAMEHTPPAWVEGLLEELGVPLKVERGGRVFPQSDRAADIIDALFFRLRELRVPVIQDRAVNLVLERGKIVAVKGERQRYPCKAVILATGGVSYPGTGSTGDGYDLAQAVGHTIMPLRPSLVPLVEDGNVCRRMQGLSLKNVSLKVTDGKKKAVYQEQGELLFTHFGLSGPLVLSASAHMRDWERGGYVCHIDFKPALEEQTLDARLVRELQEGANRDMGNILGTLLPQLMIPIMLELCQIPQERKGHDVTKGERRRLLEGLKDLPIPVKGPRPIAEAIVTSGGVKVSEVDPKTMASKRVPGLYLAGELLDVDAYTGGFNLQIAWATGRAAGEGAARSLKEDEG